MILIAFGGCAPAPKQVWIDLAQFKPDAQERSARVDGPQIPTKQGGLAASMQSRPVRHLQESEGAALWAEALETLRANRERSRERLQRDLERKYLGEERAKVIEAEKQAELEDDANWQATLAKARSLVEDYAARRADFAVDLATRIGFPDNGQAPPPARSEAIYREWREQKIATIRGEIQTLDDEFQAKLGEVLGAYESGVRDRRARLKELDYAADQAGVARAAEDADKAIREVMGQVDAAVPELSRELAALPAKNLTGKGPAALKPGFATAVWQKGLTQKEIEKYAKVFLDSKGYRMVKDRRAHDATEEFREWLNRNAVTR